MNLFPIRLLVSVRDAAEAEAALRGGADIIDAKEPNRGALGAVSAAALREIIEAVGDRRPISAAAGDSNELDACEWRDDDAAMRALSFVKVGLPGTGAAGAAGAASPFTSMMHRASMISPAQLVVVAYADHARVDAPPVQDVVAFAIEQRCRGVLIDTASKDGGCLFDLLDERVLAEVIESCRDADVGIALAGSLRGESFARAARLRPDILGVRGAACGAGDRRGRIDAARVAELKRCLTAGRAALAS